MDTVNIRVAGVTFEGRQDLILNHEVGEVVRLQPEPTNPYDANAIAVLAINGDHLGYIPKSKTKYFPSGEAGHGKIVRIFNEPGVTVGLTIQVDV